MLSTLRLSIALILLILYSNLYVAKERFSAALSSLLPTAEALAWRTRVVVLDHRAVYIDVYCRDHDSFTYHHWCWPVHHSFLSWI